MKPPKLPGIRRTLLLVFRRAVFRRGGRIQDRYPMSHLANYFLSRVRQAAIYLLLLSRVKLPIAVSPVRDHMMHLDAKDSLHLSIRGFYEPLVTELLERRIGEGDTVLDIGAHIGYHTLICARAVGRRGRVFAFEPAPDNLAVLRKNVEGNGYRNVSIEQKAVAKRGGTIRLYLSEDTSVDHRTYNLHDGRRSIEVEAVRLDDRFAEERVDLIKMDIQGAEADAIQGARELLRRNKTVDLVTEFWPVGLREYGVEPEGYLSLLVEQGFELFNIDEERGKVERTSTEELLRRYPPGRPGDTNLLCTRDPEGDGSNGRS